MAKPLPVFTNKNQLPITLSPSHIRVILGGEEPMGERQVYEFLNEVERMKEPLFPVHRVGRLLKVPRDPFFAWLESGKKVTA